jgi:hypothetical protein
MIGVSESTQRLNAKVVTGSRVAGFDMNFVGGWTFSTIGAVGNGTNTYWYIDKDYQSSTMDDTHFATYQTDFGETAAYDITVAQDNIPGTTFVIMTADWNNSGDGIYDYDLSDGVNYETCPEPVSNLMSYANSITGDIHVFQNDIYINRQKVTTVDISKKSLIYGGVDVSNEIYTNRSFGYVSFGRRLEDGEAQDYQKCINRFEASMSRAIY